MIAEKNNSYYQAELNIRKAIALHPEGYSYYETLAKVLFKRGKYDESIEYFRYLLDNDKRLTDYYKAYYHLWIGKAYLKSNRIREAKDEFKIVKSVNIEKLNNEITALTMEY